MPHTAYIVSSSYLTILLGFVSFGRLVHGMETLPLVHCNKAVNDNVFNERFLHTGKFSRLE